MIDLAERKTAARNFENKRHETSGRIAQVALRLFAKGVDTLKRTRYPGETTRIRMPDQATESSPQIPVTKKEAGQRLESTQAGHPADTDNPNENPRYTKKELEEIRQENARIRADREQTRYTLAATDRNILLAPDIDSKDYGVVKHYSEKEDELRRQELGIDPTPRK